MFINKSNYDVVDIAALKANQLLSNQNFISDILHKEIFDMSEVDSVFIVNSIIDFKNGIHGELKVYTYRPKWRWSKAYGYFSPATPDHIYLNAYKLTRFADNKRNTASLVASLIHESIHYLSYKTGKGFNHGDNSPNGKNNTAPYWIDNLAESYILGQEMSQDYGNGGNIIIYKPWYKKLWQWIRVNFS